VHFQYRTRTWIDALLPVLVRELARHEEWRGAATGLPSPGLLKRATEALRAIVADDLGPRTTSSWDPSSRFRRRAGVGLGIDAVRDDGGLALRTIVAEPAGEGVTTCELGPAVASAFEWIAARSPADTFGLGDVPTAAAASREDVVELFGVLVEAGVVAPVAPSR
jgi:hypothetical protein